MNQDEMNFKNQIVTNMLLFEAKSQNKKFQAYMITKK